MDSLPTGATQSWLIVAAVAFSPALLLFLADVIGRVRRRVAVRRAQNDPVRSKVPIDRRGSHRSK
jgi:hypothetical protein